MNYLKTTMLGVASAIVALCSCTNGAQQEKTLSGIDPADFDTVYTDAVKGEKAVKLFTLKNEAGMEVCITNFGGRIVSVMVPDKDGNFQDVVLGFDNAASYFPTNNSTDYGSAIGRYANRLNQGKIVCDSDTIQLPQNNYGHCLHGGPTGWQYQVYDGEQVDDTTLKLTMDSPDGDNNFPGNVKATVTYKLTADNAIEITYEATTDRETVINMTNHSYFNLSGNPENTVLDEILMVDADTYTPVDSTFMTTGEKAAVEGTPMDFRTPKKIGQDIDNVAFDQLLFARGEAAKVSTDKGGYDHNWCLNTAGDAQKVAVRLVDPRSGISLEVYTNEPGIQVYTGNFQDGTCTGKKDITYNRQCAICLETQKYPDSPNKAWQESNAYLEPGETYMSYCKFKFGVEK